MTKMQDMVHMFQCMMDQPITFLPEWPDENIVELHKSLIAGEYEEVMEVLDGPHDRESLVKFACELADLLFVTFGAANACGIELDEVFNFVAQNNLTKVAGPVLENGKRGKSANHTDPADVVRHMPQFSLSDCWTEPDE